MARGGTGKSCECMGSDAGMPSGSEPCLQPGELRSLGCIAFGAVSAAVDTEQVHLAQPALDLALRVAEGVGGIAVAGPLDHLFDELDLAGRVGEILRPEAHPIVVGDHPERAHHTAVETLREVVLGEVGRGEAQEVDGEPRLAVGRRELGGHEVRRGRDGIAQGGDDRGRDHASHRVLLGSAFHPIWKSSPRDRGRRGGGKGAALAAGSEPPSAAAAQRRRRPTPCGRQVGHGGFLYWTFSSFLAFAHSGSIRPLS